MYFADLGKGIYLSQAYVKKEYRGQGIYRQLLNELVNKELLACIGTTKRRRYIKPVD